MTERGFVNPFKDDMNGRLLLGKYRIVRRLAMGGMGVVYLARQEGAAGFAKPVVIKLILPLLAANAEFSGMFAREAKILANLQHPGIVSAIDFAEEQNGNVMVLEYVHGYQLGEWRRFLTSKNRTIPTDVVIHLVISVLDALHYAHTLKNHQGEPMRIIHRDVSPSNIMIDTDGHVKLVDFGIAFSEEADGEYRTTNKSFKGKLPYSAPELFANQKASVRSDVYAAGVTLHELLFGKNEFNLKDHASIIQAVLSHVPTSVHVVRNDAPERIDEVIWKAVAKKPSHRFQTAAEFALALREISTVPEHKSLSMLADLARKDFTDEMSDFLGVESLTSRERAWRSPSMTPTLPPSYELDPQPALVVNTLNLSGKSNSGQTPASVASKKNVKLALIVGAGLALVAALGVSAYLLLMPKKVEERRFLLVQNTAFDDAAKTPEPPLDEGANPADEAALATPDESGKGVENVREEAAGQEEKKASQARRTRKHKDALSSNGEPDPEALTAAFKKRKSAVERCFKQYPDDVEQDTKISVLFTVEPSGKVRQVVLSPESMRQKPLGKCLAGVSQDTRFPPQKAEVSFRIPLSASRVKQ